MKSGYRYGIWDFIKLWDFPANRIGGHQKPWGITSYGFPRRWVKAESTVYVFATVLWNFFKKKSSVERNKT